MLNIRRFQNGLQIIGTASSTVSQLGEMEVLISATKLNYHNGTSASFVVTEQHASQGANRLENKDLDAPTLAIVDSADTTKQVTWDVSPATTATHTELQFAQTANRIITFPDASGFLVLSGSSGVITNNLLDESSVWFVDHTDITKAFKFDVSAATTGTSVTLHSAQTANRVLSLPDLTDFLVSRTSIDTLTNKTLTSPILNTPTADTITGIAGGALVVQSASNQNLTLQSQGTGVVNISGTLINLQNLIVTNDTISGSSTADFSIITQTNHNLQFSPDGTGISVFNKAVEFVQNIRTDRQDDSSTTGSAATLSVPVTSYVKVTNASLVSLSAIPAGSNGQQLILSNQIGTSFVINNEDAGVTAANRIVTGTNAPLTINNNSSVSLIYDSGASRWKVFGGAGGGAVPTLFGTRGSPELIVAGTGLSAGAGNMSTTATEQAIFVAGNGGPVTVTASPAIQAGSIIGQRMIIIGRDNTNTVTFNNSSGALEMNGNVTLGLDDVISLIWDGTAWVETSRSR